MGPSKTEPVPPTVSSELATLPNPFVVAYIRDSASVAPNAPPAEESTDRWQLDTVSPAKAFAAERRTRDEPFVAPCTASLYLAPFSTETACVTTSSVFAPRFQVWFPVNMSGVSTTAVRGEPPEDATVVMPRDPSFTSSVPAERARVNADAPSGRSKTIPLNDVAESISARVPPVANVASNDPSPNVGSTAPSQFAAVENRSSGPAPVQVRDSTAGE